MVCFQACHYQSIGNSMTEGRFMDVLWELDYRMRGHTHKEKLAECTAASHSFTPVISSRILLLVETEEVHVMEGDGVEDKVENIDCFVTSEQEAVTIKEPLSTIGQLHHFLNFF